MKLASLHDLYVNELHDLHSAESMILKALPKMTKAASSPELQQAFQEHLAQTRTHVDRLNQVLEKLGERSKSKKCKGMEGLIAEGKEVLEQDAEPSVLDAALIASAQRVEHYEMAAYGCVRTYANLLGDPDAATLLAKTLEEEKKADHKLTEIAEGHVNPAAESEPNGGKEPAGKSRPKGGKR